MGRVDPGAARMVGRLVTDFDDVCLPCRAGLHYECSGLFDDTVADEAPCCCDGKYSAGVHLAQMFRERMAAGEEPPPKTKKGKTPTFEAAEPPRGNSGYIHPDAWPSTRDIGTLDDPASTGRKRVAEMYPITGGQVCDWARLANAGGGPRPIIGCMGSPASDIHHGPDKNTLNNAAARRGVGDTDNVWFLCSDCHNSWHAANDEFYPAYDRIAQQAQPWIPYTVEPWGSHTPETASFEELSAEEQRREKVRAKRGKEHRGRNHAPRSDPNTTVRVD